VPIPVLVLYVLTPGVENPEVTSEIPKSVTDAVGGKNVEHAGKPGEENGVWCFVPTL
jgi:hypothetical protein